MNQPPKILIDDGIELFAGNPQARCPVSLVLDTSGSMQGAPIAELQQAVRMFYQEIARDPLASLRVSPSVVAFGGKVTQIVPFSQNMVAGADAPEQLVAEGNTPLGAAICAAVQTIKEQIQLYRQHAIPSYRPWVILMSDGHPTDEWRQAASELKELSSKGWTVLCIAIGSHADLTALAECSTIEPRRIGTLEFAPFFRWLSTSLKAESRSAPSNRQPIGLPATLGSTVVN
jgi:uncharacterized protein YegL